jgi:Ca2+-binding EF-hand superfamily protein
VEIVTLVNNLTGEHHQTADYQHLMLKRIRCHMAKADADLSRQFKRMCEKSDANNDGGVHPIALKEALRKCKIDTPDIELDRFIRFIDKTPGGKVNYERFFDEVEGDKANPMRVLHERIHKFITIQ